MADEFTLIDDQEVELPVNPDGIRSFNLDELMARFKAVDAHVESSQWATTVAAKDSFTVDVIEFVRCEWERRQLDRSAYDEALRYFLQSRTSGSSYLSFQQQHPRLFSLVRHFATIETFSTRYRNYEPACDEDLNGQYEMRRVIHELRGKEEKTWLIRNSSMNRLIPVESLTVDERGERMKLLKKCGIEYYAISVVTGGRTVFHTRFLFAQGRGWSLASASDLDFDSSWVTITYRKPPFPMFLDFFEMVLFPKCGVSWQTFLHRNVYLQE